MTNGNIDSDTKSTATQVWTILKTLLFTCIRLSQQVLTTALFIPSPRTSQFTSTPYTVALSTLATLSHLSFVLPTFGSVSSTSSSSLPELLKTFYTALDILSSSAISSADFIKTLNKEVDDMRMKGELSREYDQRRWELIELVGVTRNICRAKEAFALACAEQLVSVLNDATIRGDVWPLCEP
jgi:hypothetical protein